MRSLFNWGTSCDSGKVCGKKLETAGQLRRNVGGIRLMQLGSSVPYFVLARKSLVATQPIKTGELFSADNITAKRPGAGISPMCWDEVLGQVAKKDYEKDDLI
ncbi:MAG: hypothetical protein KKF00_13625 [Proteobacteria bacterium]|nr:hypothetical protein [Pseudomonadota bacterium]